MKQVYIHIGAHKSASTTIQRSLQRNKEIVKENTGVFYRRVNAIEDKPLFDHFLKLGINCFTNNEDFKNSLETAKSFVINDLKDNNFNKIFYSHEGFLGNLNIQKYGFYSDIDKIVESIRYIFEGYKIHIMLLTRRQDTFIESCYTHQYKNNVDWNFDNFTKDLNILNFSWFTLIEKFLSIVKQDQIFVYPFEEIKNLGTKYFLELIFEEFIGENLDSSKLNIVEIANQSLSKEGIEIAQSLGPQLKNKKSKKEFLSILLREFPAKNFSKPVQFNEFNRNNILKICEEDNKKLFSKYITGLDSMYYAPIYKFS